jgi:hypothetical protein
MTEVVFSLLLGPQVRLTVKPTSTIGTIRSAVARRLSAPATDLVFIFHSQVLRNDQLVKTLAIPSDEFILVHNVKTPVMPKLNRPPVCPPVHPPPRPRSSYSRADPFCFPRRFMRDEYQMRSDSDEDDLDVDENWGIPPDLEGSDIEGFRILMSIRPDIDPDSLWELFNESGRSVSSVLRRLR